MSSATSSAMNARLLAGIATSFLGVTDLPSYAADLAAGETFAS